MKKLILSLVGLFVFNGAVLGQTLDKGDVGIIGVGVDDEQVLLVALNDIPAGEILFITDEEWAGSSFSSGEGFFKWETPEIDAGIVITLNMTLRKTSLGDTLKLEGGSFALGNSGDGVFIYQTSTNTYNTGDFSVIGFAAKSPA